MTEDQAAQPGGEPGFPKGESKHAVSPVDGQDLPFHAIPEGGVRRYDAGSDKQGGTRQGNIGNVDFPVENERKGNRQNGQCDKLFSQGIEQMVPLHKGSF